MSTSTGATQCRLATGTAKEPAICDGPSLGRKCRESRRSQGRSMCPSILWQFTHSRRYMPGWCPSWTARTPAGRPQIRGGAQYPAAQGARAPQRQDRPFPLSLRWPRTIIRPSSPESLQRFRLVSSASLIPPGSSSITSPSATTALVLHAVLRVLCREYGRALQTAAGGLDLCFCCALAASPLLRDRGSVFRDIVPNDRARHAAQHAGLFSGEGIRCRCQQDSQNKKSTQHDG